MSKLPSYEQLDRMELFVFLQPFILDDDNDIPIIHEMLQKHVFDKKPCYDAVHIMIGSRKVENQAVFTFYRDNVKCTEVPPYGFTGKEVFEQNNVEDPRDPHHLCEILCQLDEQVDKKLFEYLNKEYPLENTTWEEEAEIERKHSEALDGECMERILQKLRQPEDK